MVRKEGGAFGLIITQGEDQIGSFPFTARR
jgi:hypothetical protein